MQYRSAERLVLSNLHPQHGDTCDGVKSQLGDLRSQYGDAERCVLSGGSDPCSRLTYIRDPAPQISGVRSARLGNVRAQFADIRNRGTTQLNGVQAPFVDAERRAASLPKDPAALSESLRGSPSVS